MSTPERPRMPGSPIDNILARGVTEGRPIERAIAMELPNLNNHPRIRYDGAGKLFIFSDNSPAGNRGWVVFDDVESALNAKPIIMDRYDRHNEDFGVRIDRTAGLVNSLRGQLRKHFLEKDALALDGVAAKIIVDGRFTDVPKDERAKILDQVLTETVKVNFEDIDDASQFTPIWELATGFVYRMGEFMAGQQKIGVIETFGVERAIERFMLEQAASFTKYVSTLRPGQKKPGEKMPLKDALDPLDLFFRLDMPNNTMRLSPYSDVAVWARFLVLGRANSEISLEALTKYFGKVQAGHMFNTGTQLRSLTSQNGAPERAGHIASTISSVLDQGDANLLTGLKS